MMEVTEVVPNEAVADEIPPSQRTAHQSRRRHGYVGDIELTLLSMVWEGGPDHRGEMTAIDR